MDEKKNPLNDKDVQDNKIMAALSYIWIVSVLMLLMKKDSPFVQQHARQGFVLFVASVIFTGIPILWWLNIVVAIYALFGIWKAAQGEAWKAPFISMIAEKIKF